MSVLNGGSPTLSDYRRLEIENRDLAAANAALRIVNERQKHELQQRLSPRQIRDVLDRNAHLEAVNAALVKRNTILADKLKA